MNNKLKLIAIAITISLAFACTAMESSNPIKPAADTQIYRSKGIITAINKEKNTITIDHEDIPGYMPAMEMDRPVKEKAMLEIVEAGDKVDFEIERTGSKIAFSKLTKTGETAVAIGEEIFKTNCAECHGQKGEGSKKGISLIKGHAVHHTEAEHIKQVADGEGKKMPGFKEKLSAEEIKEVVSFVRNSLQKGTPREESHKHSH